MRLKSLGFTLGSRRLYAEKATALRRKADAIWPKTQENVVENQLAALPRGIFKPLFRSGSTCRQVLNFDNNILHFVHGACKAVHTISTSQPRFKAAEILSSICVAVGKNVKPRLHFTLCLATFFSKTPPQRYEK